MHSLLSTTPREARALIASDINGSESMSPRERSTWLSKLAATPNDVPALMDLFAAWDAREEEAFCELHGGVSRGDDFFGIAE